MPTVVQKTPEVFKMNKKKIDELRSKDYTASFVDGIIHAAY